MDLLPTLIGSIIGSVILSIIANLLTDPVKNRLAKRSLVSRRKRVDELKKELDRITLLYNDRQRLYLELSGVAMGSLQAFLIVIITIIPTMVFAGAYMLDPAVFGEITVFMKPFIIISLLISAVYVTIASFSFTKHQILINKVKDFDEYKRRTEDRIKELSQEP